jgi:AcrR family transcriptional regulator
MLDAGLDLFGTQGYTSTTVDQVCRQAGVSTRSFYEEFDNRMALLVAVGERIAARAFAAFTAPRPVRSEERLHARVAAAVHSLTDDPRVARVAFVESLAIDAVETTRRRELLQVFPDWIATYLAGYFDQRGVPEARRRPLSVAAFGSGTALISEWALAPDDGRGVVDDLVDDVVDTVAAILDLPAATSGWRSPKPPRSRS